MRSGLSAFKGVVLFMGMALLTGAKTNGCGPDLGGGEYASVRRAPRWVRVRRPGVRADSTSLSAPRGPSRATFARRRSTTRRSSIRRRFDDRSRMLGRVRSHLILPPPVCPDGTMEQVICAGSTEPDPGMGGGKDDPYPGDLNDPVPPEEQCWTECVPIYSDLPARLPRGLRLRGGLQRPGDLLPHVHAGLPGGVPDRLAQGDGLRRVRLLRLVHPGQPVPARHARRVDLPRRQRPVLRGVRPR